MHLQNEFTPLATKSLEDIRTQIAAEPPSNGRRDTLSAMGFVAKHFGLLSNIDASPRTIHQLFASKNGPALGVSQKRYLNARSLVVHALDRYGATPMKLIERFGRSPEWTALVEQVPDTNRRSAINRLACFCTATGVGPDGVTRDVLLAFHAAVASEQAIKDPRSILRNAIAYWNEASRKIPGWPQYTLSSPFERNFVVLPEDQFPESFSQDIARWVQRGAHPDPFEDDGLSKPLRAATLRAQEKHIWRFASLLVRKGIIPANALVSLRALVNPELVKAGLKLMLEENDNAPSGYIANVASLFRKIAKYDLRLPSEELQQLEKFSARMSKGRNRTMTDANRQKLALFDDPGVLAEFLSVS
ncbi:MAG: hypothetical protein ACTHPD_09605 [Rhizomicrobium sp.]